MNFAEADKEGIQQRNEEAKKGFEEAAEAFSKALEDAKRDREDRRKEMKAMNAIGDAIVKSKPAASQQPPLPPRMRQVGGEHYVSLAVQPWDAIEAWLTPEAFQGFLHGNAIKYLARANKKGGVEDLRKAAHYIEKLIAVMVKV